MQQNNIQFGSLWLDIESTLKIACYGRRISIAPDSVAALVGSGVPSWGTCSENVAFLQGLVSAAQGQGWNVALVHCTFLIKPVGWHLLQLLHVERNRLLRWRLW